MIVEHMVRFGWHFTGIILMAVTIHNGFLEEILSFCKHHGVNEGYAEAPSSADECRERPSEGRMFILKSIMEGRMKGQAFITFPSVELAQNALNLVNGYVFKGKPIVIQFGRNTAPAKAN